jgi:hypothetical protein
VNAAPCLRRRCALAAALLAGSAALARAEVPIVSVCYRGAPAGVPRQDDLALIRSLGFRAVSWPTAHAAALPAVRRLAQLVGLQVVTDPDDPVAADTVVHRFADRVRIRVDRVPGSGVPALAWAAIAGGARLIAFDAGEPAGHGLAEASGQERAWVRPAVAFAQQLWASAALLDDLRPGPTVTFESAAPPGVTAGLFAAPRTWVIIAANAGRTRADLVLRLPVTAPYALWTSLLDGSTMSMLSEPAGPRWSVQLAPGQAVVYFIDRPVSGPGKTYN